MLKHTKPSQIFLHKKNSHKWTCSYSIKLKNLLKHSINTWRHKHVQINILTYSLTWLIHVHRLAHIQSQICFKFTSCSHTWTCLHIQLYTWKIVIHYYLNTHKLARALIYIHGRAPIHAHSCKLIWMNTNSIIHKFSHLHISMLKIYMCSHFDLLMHVFMFTHTVT